MDFWAKKSKSVSVVLIIATDHVTPRPCINKVTSTCSWITVHRSVCRLRHVKNAQNLNHVHFFLTNSFFVADCRLRHAMSVQK